MHLPVLISDLAIILLTGGVVTVLFKKLNQPLVLGYIVAGFLIGPYMPFFYTVSDSVSISTWSEIGILILMFGLGLEFNLHKLVKVGGTALITALTEVCGMLLLGFFAGQAMGWATMDSVFLGGMLSMSSTTIIIKVFDELGLRQAPFAQGVFGTLVVEDIAGIFMMIILSTISVSQNITGGALALQLGMLVLYLALWLILGIYLLPTLLQKATPLMNDETLLVTSLGICFGMVLLADALGFSSALGAFLAGSLLAGTVHAERIEHLTQGVKDLFGAVFFLSVGMMLDPAMVARYIIPILILTLVTLFGKLFFSSLGSLLAGQPLPNAIRCGCSLAQIGEFAFIIASLGLSLGVIADYIYPIIISVSVITTLTTPFCIRFSDKLAAFVQRILPKRAAAVLSSASTTDDTEREQDNDWAVFLRRFVKVTLLYGVIMLGIVLLGQYLLQPLLGRLPLRDSLTNTITLAAVYLGMALFVRPMLDLRAPQTSLLWMKKRAYRVPLSALTVLRLLIVVMLAFLPLQTIVHVQGLWLLPVIALAIFLCARSGWLASRYFKMEARFLANFNERQLERFTDSGEVTEWLDEQLFVDSFSCPADCAGQSLRQLGWGRRYGVNVIRLEHGRRRSNMPPFDALLSDGDRVVVLGEAENLRSLRTGLSLPSEGTLPTLRDFLAGESKRDGALYSCAVSAGHRTDLSGKSIRESGLRDRFSCMILGLQHGALPIVRPDVDRVIESGDLVWILGTRDMVDQLVAEGIAE